MGTAGAMLDFSFAAGLAPMLSSFSRRVFSWEMILRVAMDDGVDGRGVRSRRWNCDVTLVKKDRVKSLIQTSLPHANT